MTPSSGLYGRIRYISRGLITVAVILSLGGLPIQVSAQDGPKFKGIGDKARVTIDNLAVDKVKREVHLDVNLAITEGILEYLLVGNEGKTYESVFKVQGNRPSDLNFALLLIGCEPVPFDVYNKNLQTGGGIDALKGKFPNSFLKISIYENGKQINEGKLIKDREKKNLSLKWVFTGSYFDNSNRFAADLELSYIGIWPDPVAVINLVSTHENPYRGEGGFEMNAENATRFENKKITLIIQKVTP